MAIRIDTDISGMQIAADTADEMIPIIARLLDELNAHHINSYKRENGTYYAHCSEIHNDLINDYAQGVYDEQ